MLQLQSIRDNKEKVLEGLKKRNFKEAVQLIEAAIHHDMERRTKQIARDQVSSELNQMSSKIGALMKEGKKEEAEQVRGLVASKKEGIKVLEEELRLEENKLQEILYKIPNIPAEKVPAGKGPEENLNLFQHGTMPSLPPGSQPHWFELRT